MTCSFQVSVRKSMGLVPLSTGSNVTRCFEYWIYFHRCRNTTHEATNQLEDTKYYKTPTIHGIQYYKLQYDTTSHQQTWDFSLNCRMKPSARGSSITKLVKMVDLSSSFFVNVDQTTISSASGYTSSCGKDHDAPRWRCTAGMSRCDLRKDVWRRWEFQWDVMYIWNRYGYI